MTEIEQQILKQANKKNQKGILGFFRKKYKTLTTEACCEIEELELKRVMIDSFSILQQLPNLRSIYFYGCQFSDSCYEEAILFEQIEEVDFEAVPLKDLWILEHFPNLQKIAFWDYGSKQKISMSGIESVSELRRFYSVNTLFTEMEQLAVCENLRWLEMDNYLPDVIKKQEGDYSFVNHFQDLIHIGLMTGNVEDVSFLCKNKKLHEIILCQNTELKNLELLSELKELNKIDLDDCKIPYNMKKKLLKLFSYVENVSIEN